MIREVTREENTTAHHPSTDTQPDPSSDLGLPGNFPQFIYWARCAVVWNTPLASLGQVSWLCSVSASHAPSHWQSMKD